MILNITFMLIIDLAGRELQRARVLSGRALRR